MIRLLTILFFLTLPMMVDAQCAMCRMQVVNNVSSGSLTLAQGLNYGILYLFFAPYLMMGVVAYFWYKTSKKNERKVSLNRRY